MPAALCAIGEILLGAVLSGWFRKWKRADITRCVHRIAMAGIPGRVLVRHGEVQPVLLVATGGTVALRHIAPETNRGLPLDELTNFTISRANLSPLDHGARREHVGDGEEGVEEHGHAQQHIVEHLIATELPDPHQNGIQRVVVITCCRRCRLRIPMAVGFGTPGSLLLAGHG